MYPTSLHEIETEIARNRLVLLLIKAPNCGVCTAVEPWVDGWADKRPVLTAVKACIGSLPELAGRFHALTAPVIILFYQGKEVERFARFIPQAAFDAALEKWTAFAEQEGGAV